MSLVSQRLLDSLGRSSEPRDFVVEPGMVRAFREAVGIDDGLPHTVAPSTFVVNANMRLGLRIDVASLLDFDATTLNAGTVYRFSRNLRVGDRLLVQYRLDSAVEKMGKSGPMLFVDSVYQYSLAAGEHLGECRQTTVHRPRVDAPASTRSAQVPEDEGAFDWIHTRPVTTRQLVQWAGASGDFNPLHYDLDFARASGFERVVVTGSLKLAMTEAVLRSRYPGQIIRELSIRHVGSDLAGEVLRLGSRHDGSGLALRVAGPRGTSMTGTALLEHGS